MGSGSDSNGWNRARGLVLKALVLVGGAVLLKRLTKSTTRWDHARIVADAVTGEKFSREQASRDPDNFFNLSYSPQKEQFFFLDRPNSILELSKQRQEELNTKMGSTWSGVVPNKFGRVGTCLTNNSP